MNGDGTDEQVWRGSIDHCEGFQAGMGGDGRFDGRSLMAAGRCISRVRTQIDV